MRAAHELTVGNSEVPNYQWAALALVGEDPTQL